MLDKSNQLKNLTEVDKWHLAWCLRYPQYSERPVDIKTFIDSPRYMNAKDECWEPIKQDLIGLFEGYDSSYMEWKHNEAVFDEGIGAGKSYKASIIIAYLVYRILILHEPQRFLHLAKGSGIYFINMSIRSDQAKKVVFGEIAQRVMNAPWFNEKGYVPDTSIKSELRFPKNIYVIPGNSKETFPLGFNLLGGVMDEAAWYTETETHDVAEEIFNALHNRIKNRFNNRGMLVMISSPRYIDDFIEKKMEEAFTNKRIFSARRTSWDSKPAALFSGEKFERENYSIPVEYRVEADRNWERFKRDYMAIPCLSLEPYFKQWNLVEQCIDVRLQNPIIEDEIMHSWFKGNSNYSYFMHIDLSLVSDASGIAMCHREGENIIVDYMRKIRPPQGGEIDLSQIRNIVSTLKSKGFNIQKCTYDQFQSASSIQELNKMGINSEKLSVDRELAPYETLKEAMYTGKLRMFRCDDLLDELKRLELIKGKKVDHPANSSKDLSDALAGAVYNCVSNKNNFMCWVAGSSFIPKTPEEIKKETEVLTVDDLVPYGYFKGRRM